MRKNWLRDLSIATLTLAAAGGATAWKFGKLDAIVDKSNGAVSACEEATKSVIESPDSYRREWVDFGTDDRLSLAQYTEYYDAQGCSPGQLFANQCQKSLGQAILDADWLDELPAMGVMDPAKATRKQRAEARERAKYTRYNSYLRLPSDKARAAHVTLEYDAANPFGASQRSFVLCEFGPTWYDRQYEVKDLRAFGELPTQIGQETRRLANSLK